jgi:hypothetical protein
MTTTAPNVNAIRNPENVTITFMQNSIQFIGAPMTLGSSSVIFDISIPPRFSCFYEEKGPACLPAPGIQTLICCPTEDDR